MPGPVLIALAVVGATLMASGVVLVIDGWARLSGILLALAGAGAVTAALLEHASGQAAATRTLTVAMLVGLTGLAAYPDPERWRLADVVAFGLVAIWVPVGVGAAIVDSVSLGDAMTRALAPQTIGAIAVASVCLHTLWRFERARRGGEAGARLDGRRGRDPAHRRVGGRVPPTDGLRCRDRSRGVGDRRPGARPGSA